MKKIKLNPAKMYGFKILGLAQLDFRLAAKIGSKEGVKVTALGSKIGGKVGEKPTVTPL